MEYQKYLELIGKGITLVFIDNPTVCNDYIIKIINTADQQNIVTWTAMEGIVNLMLIVELDRVEQDHQLPGQMKLFWITIIA